jgi:hypothetical protein
MARPKLKTETTTLKMTPVVRDLWEQCAEQEYRSLTSMFEVMVRDYAKKVGVQPSPAPALELAPPSAKIAKTTKTK